MDENGDRVFRGGTVCATVMSVATSHWSDCPFVPLGKEKGGKVTIQVERQMKGQEAGQFIGLYY